MKEKDVSPEEGEPDFYYDEHGLLVFTEMYHLKRGDCCKNGCRNCPYGYGKNGTGEK